MKYIIIILYFCIFYITFNIINFYQVKNIQPTLWNLVKYNLYLTPIYLILNVIVTMTFSRAYSILEKIWPVNIMYWGAGVIVTFLITFVFFREIPKSNVLIGLILTVSGIIVANYKA